MELKELMKLTLQEYGGALYNSALTKLIYLLDIESVKQTGEQITPIHWRKDYYGPFVWDIINCAEKDTLDFEVIYQPATNGEKKLILLKEPIQVNSQSNIKKWLCKVKNHAPDPNRDFSKFLRYVYDTTPMQVALGNKELDIKSAIKAEQEVNALLAELDTPEWDEAFQYLASH